MRRSNWNRRASTAALAGLLALTGCVTVGNPFPSRPVKKIELGTTRQEDVRRLFGEPWRKGLDNGFESWTYRYNRWQLLGDVQARDLYVVFNKDGTVRAYTYNSNIDD